MLKKLFFGCLLLLGLLAGGLFFVWRQATHLPDWYQEARAVPETRVDSGAGAESFARPEQVDSPAGGLDEPSLNDTPNPAARTRAKPPPRSTPPRSTPPRVSALDLRPVAGRIEIDERQLNELLDHGLREHPRGQGLGRAVRAARASIDGDRLEVGIVTHLADLAAAADGARESEAIRKLGRLAPWLAGHEFFIAARGTPEARNGHLFFGRGVEVKIGGFAFDAGELATRLGIRPEKIDRGLEIPLADFDVEGVEVTNGALVLTLRE